MNLITAWEAVKWGPASDKFPLHFILLADVVDFGGLNEWKATSTYATGDRVIYFGAVVESKVDNNTIEPCTEDFDSYWLIPKKFGTACHNTLWEKHLRGYLAFALISEAVDYATLPISAKGVTEFLDDQTHAKTAEFQSLIHMKKKLENDAAQRLEQMIQYIEDTKETCPLVGYEYETCGQEYKKPRSRRIYLRH